MHHDYDIHRTCKRCGFSKQGLGREPREDERLCPVDALELARKFSDNVKSYDEFLKKEIEDFNARVKR